MAYLIPRNTTYNYQQLARIDGPKGRAYVVSEGKQAASVTTILDQTKNKEMLKQWANRVGQEEANRQKNEAAHVGTCMHKTIECLLADEPLSMGQDWLALRGHEMALRLINKYFINLQMIYGSEVTLNYEGRYAGTADLVAVYRNRLAIVDFKQSVKPKRHEYITDYFHQLAAYAMAHDAMFGTNIDFGVVLVSVQDGTTQEFTTTGREWQNFKTQWLARLTAWEAALPSGQSCQTETGT